jgi:hypothetical protein
MPEKPFVSVTVCERILMEKDGVSSIIRIVDEFTVRSFGLKGVAREQAEPGIVIKIPFSAWAYIAIKPRTPGKPSTHKLEPRVITPSGKPMTATKNEIDIHLTGAVGGFTVNLELAIDAGEPGIYWLEVLLDGELVFRHAITLRNEGSLTGEPIQNAQ